jgi:hypothetical protein
MYSRRDTQVTEGTQRTYMDLLLSGEALPQDIDDFVDAWHDAPEGSGIASQSLEEFLGMSWNEYQLWVEQPESLRFIAAAHKACQPVDVMLERADMMLAARGNDQDEARKLLHWLIERGRIEDRPRNRRREY